MLLRLDNMLVDFAVVNVYNPGDCGISGEKK